MSIPDYQTCMLPLLLFASDGEIYTFAEAVESLASTFQLSPEEKKELLPSGSQFLFANRVGWARTYLKKAGLLSTPKRGSLQITEQGRKLLQEKPQSINSKYLERFESFNEFRSISGPKQQTQELESGDTFSTPEEAMAYGYAKLTESLSSDLLEHLKGASPSFFERVVVELLVAMGYGGSLREAAQVVGKSGDAGIDGIIKEDKLGLDTIYIQAKRWENVISRPEIQKFAGALLGQKARKGIFVTTSYFSTEAIEYAQNLEAKIVLIDGKKLAQLMIENNLGVSIVETYQVKRIDTDYFVQE